MKIVYVYHSLAVWGGIERILVDKMNWLVAHGYEVVMLTADQGTHELPYAMDQRISYADLNIRFHRQYQYKGLRRLWDVVHRKWRFAKLLKQRFAEEHPDVIVCATPLFVGTLNRLRGRIPLVVESHTVFERLVETGSFRCLRRWWLLRSLRRADVLVTLTEDDAAQWRLKLDRVEVIPNMVHVPAIMQHSPLTARKVVFAGRLVPQKQIDHLVAIWQRVHQRHPDWTLEVYGEGELQDWLTAETSRNNLGIEVLPPTNQIFQVYASTSALVLTSLYEPFGLVLSEAMSCGLPVVAYDCPFGPRVIISDGENGFLVEAQQKELFADRLCQLIEDERLRLRMGQRAAESVQRFAAAHVMPQWEKLFQRLSSS